MFPLKLPLFWCCICENHDKCIGAFHLYKMTRWLSWWKIENNEPLKSPIASKTNTQENYIIMLHCNLLGQSRQYIVKNYNLLTNGDTFKDLNIC